MKDRHESEVIGSKSGEPTNCLVPVSVPHVIPTGEIMLRMEDVRSSSGYSSKPVLHPNRTLSVWVRQQNTGVAGD